MYIWIRSSDYALLEYIKSIQFVTIISHENILYKRGIK